MSTREVFNSTPGGGKWTVPTGVNTVQVLVVAGGGGGGCMAGGGGGGGGIIYDPAYSVTPGQEITVTVGAGGARAGTSAAQGGDGQSSVFGTQTAIGGGGGGGYTATKYNGRAGGSGGGGSGSTGVGGDADYISPRQGYDGGAGANGSFGAGGGGGGASGVGNTAVGDVGGAGCAGVDYSSIFGADIGETGYFGGGGGGKATANGVGGLGGGGDAAQTGESGTANTGGGGGGSASGYYSGYGGSGIVVLLYDALAHVDTTAVDEITGDGGMLNGTVTLQGASAVDYFGFIGDTSESAVNAATDEDPSTLTSLDLYWKSALQSPSLITNDTFEHMATGLASLTRYYIRAACHNTDGWSYGDTVYFDVLASHRISNSGTTGIKKGGIPVAAKVFFIDSVNDTLTAETADGDGLYTHNVYTTTDVLPKMHAFCVWDDKALLETAQGSNKDLVFTAKAVAAGAALGKYYPGAAGNLVSIAYVHTGSLSISVSGPDITVNINAGTTTAAQIKAAIEAHATAQHMVSVAYKAGQNGSGTPAAMVKTNLAGGAYYSADAYTFITPVEIV